MFDSYKAIFDQRADSYHKAMRDFPLARAQEFEWAVHYLAVKSGNSICDIPSGGGYLRDFVQAEDCYFHFLETCENFASYSSKCVNALTQVCQFEHLPLEKHSVDRLISLAALHHVQNRDQVFQEFNRVLKSQGQGLIVDVEEHTDTADFLNVFVNQYNSMGHQGDFINEQLIKQLAKQQLEVIAIHRPTLQWCFAIENDMVSFCRHLFGLDKATDKDILSGINRYLTPCQGEQITLTWQLVYIVFKLAEDHGI